MVLNIKRRTFLSSLILSPFLKFLPKKKEPIFIFNSKIQKKFFEEKEDLELFSGSFANSKLYGLPYHYYPYDTTGTWLGISRSKERK